MRKACFFAILGVVGLMAFSGVAAPHNGDRYKLAQPDGSLVPVRVFGDEFYQRIESLDGYTLVRDPKSRVIVYAKLSNDGSSLLPTSVRYDGENGTIAKNRLGLRKHIAIHAEARRSIAIANRAKAADGRRSRRPVPRKHVVGDVRGVTLLVDFLDEPAVVPKSHLEQLMNGENFNLYGNVSSVREFYADMSQGKLNYTNYVADYYRAEHPKTHYDGDDDMDKGKWLVYEALASLEQQGFDFSTLTIQGNDRITAINCLYAGSPTQGWAKGLWPHQGRLGSFFADDVQSDEYQISPIGKKPRIATICHENGHMICDYPDLYDYGGESNGAGRYCLMSSSGQGMNPNPIHAYFRNYSGWEEAVDITDAAAGTIFSSPSGYNHSFVYRNENNPDEFFYIESRVQRGRNMFLGGHGLLIWHVDDKKRKDGSGNSQQDMTEDRHFYVSLEQADGLFELENNENSGDPGDPFYKENVDEFSDSTMPAAKWWDGTNSGLHIGNISSIADTMMFTIGAEPLVNYSAAGTVRGVVDKQARVVFDGVFSGSVPVQMDRSFSVDNLVEGTYQLRAKSHNYYSSPVEITVPDSLTDIELHILRPGIDADTTPISLTVPERGTASAAFTITNPKDGTLSYGTAVGTVANDVVINEVYTGYQLPPDGVELWNRGPNLNLGGWKLIFNDNNGVYREFVFRADTVLEAGETLIAREVSAGSPESNELFLGFYLDWAFGKSDPFSVALVDGIGNGVDFFKTEGSVDSPPLGTSWLGPGVALKSIANRRVRNTDYDNASDWVSDNKFSINEVNDGQKSDSVDAYATWLTVFPAAGEVEPTETNTVTVTFDATAFNEGDVETETLFIYHNVPAGVPPLKIACEMTVIEGEHPDGGTDADSDSDSVADDDSDQDSDSDTDPDSPDSSENGCGCLVAGQTTHPIYLWFKLF